MPVFVLIRGNGAAGFGVVAESTDFAEMQRLRNYYTSYVRDLGYEGSWHTFFGNYRIVWRE